MSNRQPGDSPSKPAGPGVEKNSAPPVTTPPSENPPASQLTPEEQMALYEKELKETDWGHQPC